MSCQGNKREDDAIEKNLECETAEKSWKNEKEKNG